MTDVYNSEQFSKNSAFKSAFKYFKSRRPPPDFTKVVDLTTPDEKIGINVNFLENSTVDQEVISQFGLKPTHQWKICTLSSKPGLLLASNIFEPDAQLSWAFKFCHQYSKSPSVSNLSGTDTEKLLKYDFLGKLRWITMGYHYDWTLKEYRDEFKSEVPSELVGLFTTVAKALGYGNFRPEAVLANFYQQNSTLSGHVDRSERDLNQPLFSFSFGQSAVYLSGGISLNEEPMPIWLRSGDVIVMHGGQRLVYHGVPRIIKDNCFDSGIVDSDFIDYFNNNRVNVTIRQVN